jgi:DNA-binding transcriptional LysR family regulator
MDLANSSSQRLDRTAHAMTLHNPTIKQLEAFCWTARLGSFQAAAAHLCTSQSAVAKRVTELESLLGAQLLDRSARKSKLTAQGESLLIRAEDVLSANGKLLATMSQVAAYQGRVKLGVSELISMTWLPKLVQNIRTNHAGALLEMNVDCGVGLLTSLREGMIDVAICPGAIFGREFESIPIGSEDFAWLASPALGVSGENLTLEGLARYPILIHTAQGVSEAHINQHLCGIPGKNTMTANSMLVMSQLAINGVGVSFLPLTYLKPHLDAGALVKVNTEAGVQSLPFYVVYRKHMVHPLTESIIEASRTVCDFSAQPWPHMPLPARGAKRTPAGKSPARAARTEEIRQRTGLVPSVLQ